MEKNLSQKIILPELAKSLLFALAGATFISLLAQIKIPFYPVPATLQTFAIFLLALTQRPLTAALSLLFYLIAATAGLPVLAGGAMHPLWMVGPTAGYLLAFPLAAYVASKIGYQKESLFIRFGALLSAQVIIYTLGFIWLSTFIGAKRAWMGGVVFFLPSALLKVLLAGACSKATDYFRK